MRTYFIDTNVFLRVAIRETSESFYQCKAILEAVKRNKIEGVTANLVLAEIAWTLGSYYGLKRGQIAKTVDGIINLGGLKIVDGYDVARAIHLYMDKKVKFVDAMIASIPEISAGEWSVASYDKEFEKLSVKLVNPEKIIANGTDGV